MWKPRGTIFSALLRHPEKKIKTEERGMRGIQKTEPQYNILCVFILHTEIEEARVLDKAHIRGKSKPMASWSWLCSGPLYSELLEFYDSHELHFLSWAMLIWDFFFT